MSLFGETAIYVGKTREEMGLYKGLAYRVRIKKGKSQYVLETMSTSIIYPCKRDLKKDWVLID